MSNEESAAKTEYVTVRIYDQTYHLSGQNPDHIRALAARVDAKMRTVATQGRTVDSLRVAVLAALNLADELAQLKAQTPAPVSTPKWAAVQKLARARAANLRGLLDEVLRDERKTGS
jgi:cell division protein ZapA